MSQNPTIASEKGGKAPRPPVTVGNRSPSSVLYDPEALKEFGKLDKPTARRVVTITSWLHGEHATAGMRALVGLPGFPRVRVGGYGIVYTISDRELIHP